MSVILFSEGVETFQGRTISDHWCQNPLLPYITSMLDKLKLQQFKVFPAYLTRCTYIYILVQGNIMYVYYETNHEQLILHDHFINYSKSQPILIMFKENIMYLSYETNH